MSESTLTTNIQPTPSVKGILDRTTVAKLVNEFLASFFDESIARAQKHDEQAGELWRVIRKVTLAGGKRIRPYLLLLAYQAYGGTEAKQYLPVAVAQELLHTSMLIHDDIIDQDTFRHGQANISGSMEAAYSALSPDSNARHYADGAAILGGDLLIGAAHALISNSHVPDRQKLIALKELSDAIFYVGIGEFLDMESVLRPFDQTDALHIADLKTASYSFILPLRSGALLAEAADKEIRLLERFGTALGLAFQLADDVLGVFGDEQVTGKSASSDIREGKHTYLMERTIANSSPEERVFIQSALGNERLSESQLKRMQQLMVGSGAKAETLQKIATFSRDAREIVTSLSMSAVSKQAFLDIIDSATKRVV